MRFDRAGRNESLRSKHRFGKTLCDWFLSEMTVSIDSNLFELGDSSVSTSKPKRGADRVISHFITVHSFDKGYVMLKVLSQSTFGLNKAYELGDRLIRSTKLAIIRACVHDVI